MLGEQEVTEALQMDIEALDAWMAARQVSSMADEAARGGES